MAADARRVHDRVGAHRDTVAAKLIEGERAQSLRMLAVPREEAMEGV